MESSNLLVICISSFAVVFLILSVLAIIMHFLLVIFPVKIKEKMDNTAVIAAITSAYNRQFPGTRISNIGEEK
jgi:hypothetical protein